MRAFWKNDVFPLCLSQTVAIEHDDGSVSLYGYGRLKKEHIIAFLDDEVGDAIQAKLDLLKQERRKELKLLDDKYKKLAFEIADFLKPQPKDTL
jgi:hypothetical protein